MRNLGHALATGSLALLNITSTTLAFWRRNIFLISFVCNFSSFWRLCLLRYYCLYNGRLLSVYSCNVDRIFRNHWDLPGDVTCRDWFFFIFDLIPIWNYLLLLQTFGRLLVRSLG